MNAALPAVDKYGLAVKACAVPLPCGHLAAMGYGVGQIKPKGERGWYSAFLDGTEIIDGFTSAREAWDAIARYDDNAMMGVA